MSPIVTKIGAVKAMAVTSAKGARAKAAKNATSEASFNVARTTWRKRKLDRSTLGRNKSWAGGAGDRKTIG